MKKYIFIAIGLILIIIIIAIQKDRILSYILTQSNCYITDSIIPEDDYSLHTECYRQFKGSFFRFGYIISNYYTVCDYKGLNDDSIAVLSPKILTPEASSCRNEEERVINNRLLIVNYKGIKSVYKNVVESGIGPANCGGEFIEITSDGFILYSSFGQACYLKYKIYINYQNEELFISKIYLETQCPNDEESKKATKKYQDKEFNLLDYDRNLINSIRKEYNI